MCAHDVPSDRLADVARLIEGHGTLDRHEHVQARLAGGLHDRLEGHLLQQLTQPERDAPADRETALVELRLRALRLLAGVDVRIDVEHQIVGVVEDRGLQRSE